MKVCKRLFLKIIIFAGVFFCKGYINIHGLQPFVPASLSLYTFLRRINTSGVNIGRVLKNSWYLFHKVGNLKRWSCENNYNFRKKTIIAVQYNLERIFASEEEQKLKEAYINARDRINLGQDSFYLYDKSEIIIKKHLLPNWINT